MTLKADLEANVDAIIHTQWTKREGRVVPESDDKVKFIHDAVILDATFLYADLAIPCSSHKKISILPRKSFKPF